MANNLWQKLAAIKAAVPYLTKNQKGYNFEYANPETVLGHLNPLLLEHGVALKMEVTDENHERVTNGKGKEETLFNLRFLFTWINTEKPDEREEIRWAASGVNNDEQGVGSAMTYGLRYFMLNQFQIPTGKDDPDYLSQQRQGNKPTQKPPQKPTAPPQSTQPAKPTTDKPASLGDLYAKIGKGKEALSKVYGSEDRPDDTLYYDIITKHGAVKHVNEIKRSGVLEEIIAKLRLAYSYTKDVKASGIKGDQWQSVLAPQKMMHEYDFNWALGSHDITQLMNRCRELIAASKSEAA